MWIINLIKALKKYYKYIILLFWTYPYTIVVDKDHILQIQ